MKQLHPRPLPLLQQEGSEQDNRRTFVGTFLLLPKPERHRAMRPPRLVHGMHFLQGLEATVMAYSGSAGHVRQPAKLPGAKHVVHKKPCSHAHESPNNNRFRATWNKRAVGVHIGDSAVAIGITMGISPCCARRLLLELEFALGTLESSVASAELKWPPSLVVALLHARDAYVVIDCRCNWNFQSMIGI